MRALPPLLLGCVRRMTAPRTRRARNALRSGAIGDFGDGNAVVVVVVVIIGALHSRCAQVHAEIIIDKCTCEIIARWQQNAFIALSVSARRTAKKPDSTRLGCAAWCDVCFKCIANGERRARQNVHFIASCCAALFTLLHSLARDPSTSHTRTHTKM